MGQAQINVRTRACSRTSIARTKQAALTHNVRGKELTLKCVGRGFDNVAVQGRWPLTTGVAQGRYYCTTQYKTETHNI